MQGARINKISIRPSPSEDSFDHFRETQYCIQFSKQHLQSEKKKSFLNKCSFDYSLQKINNEKFYGNIIPLTSKIYPSTLAKGNRYCNLQYSSKCVKEGRERILSLKYKNLQSKEGYRDEFRKYRQILSKKKNQQGGIDSFWIFKKDPVKEERKKIKVNNDQGGVQNQEEIAINKTQKAFLKFLHFAKMSQQIENALIPRNTFKNYISSIFGETFTLWFMNFYEIKAYINFKEFQNIVEKFKNMSLRQSHMVSFFLYDGNGDGFLCPRDFFYVFENQTTSKIDKDILKMGNYVKKNQGSTGKVNQQYKIQSVCIRDDWLTLKDYNTYFKKVDEPFLKATNKKDTVFSKSFAVLDHRQKIRSKRREINEKKNFYQELYGQISKMKKNEAYIDTIEDYKINFSAFVDAFGGEKTEVYKLFVQTVFGINLKQN